VLLNQPCFSMNGLRVLLRHITGMLQLISFADATIIVKPGQFWTGKDKYVYLL